jgi:hypothetical protein
MSTHPLWPNFPPRRSPTPKSIAPVPQQLDDYDPLGCYVPLVQRLVGLRQERNSGIVAAFSAIARGAGVTFVTESLAWELVRQTGEQILLTTPAGLSVAASTRFGEEEKKGLQPVRRLPGARNGGGPLHDLGREDLESLRRRFGFVLVDCPPMRESSSILGVSRLCDGVVLVIAAGETGRGEIEHAGSVLKAGSADVLGLVLNKRRDPVPKFISKFL